MTMYGLPSADASLTQGDIIDGCPIFDWEEFKDPSITWLPRRSEQRVLVLTQACDLANSKSKRVQVSVVHNAERLVQLNVLKPAMIKDQIRTHRVFGLYFLPTFGDVLPESIVDLRDIHTVPRDLLEQLIGRGLLEIRLSIVSTLHSAFFLLFCVNSRLHW